MGFWMADIFELVGLGTSIIPVFLCAIVLIRTRRFQKNLEKEGINGEVRAKVDQHLERHFWNLLSSLMLFYMSLVAAYVPPVTESFQGLTSRLGTTFLSAVLTIKILRDQWHIIAPNWSSRRDRREGDPKSPVAHP